MYGKLTRTGNCHAVIVPRPAMHALGWSADEPIAQFVVNGKLIIASMRSEIDRLERAAGDAAVAAEQPANV